MLHHFKAVQQLWERSSDFYHDLLVELDRSGTPHFAQPSVCSISGSLLFDRETRQRSIALSLGKLVVVSPMLIVYDATTAHPSLELGSGLLQMFRRAKDGAWATMLPFDNPPLRFIATTNQDHPWLVLAGPHRTPSASYAIARFEKEKIDTFLNNERAKTPRVVTFT